MAIIKTFKATLPNLNKIEDTDTFFGRVKEKYPRFYREGYFKTIDEDVMIIHRVETPQGNFVGLVACTDVEDYLSGKIVRHELTLEEKERKMLELIKERGAMIKPTVLTYLKIQKITDLLSKYINKYPIYHQLNFLDEKHSFYLINKEKHIDKLTSVFEKYLPKTYIADGHHRFATAARLYKKNQAHRYQLTTFFGLDQLNINEFNRIVETLNGQSPKDFIHNLSKYFTIQKLASPRKSEQKREFVMYLDEQWYSLYLNEVEQNQLKKLPVSERLDVSILNRYVLQDVLQIQDIRSDRRVKYVEGAKGIEQIRLKVDANPNRVGFALYPINGKEFIGVSDAGETLPPKSTFFTPRMRSGFIVSKY